MKAEPPVIEDAECPQQYQRTVRVLVRSGCTYGSEVEALLAEGYTVAQVACTGNLSRGCLIVYVLNMPGYRR